MLTNHSRRGTVPAFGPVVPGLYRLRDAFVNLYFAHDPGAAPTGAAWVLIDAGLPGSAAKIMAHAAETFGAGVPPVAVVLTHGHFDHVGALDGLLAAWPAVPVFAHPLELPYLTGRSAYPAPDPLAGGGLMAWSSFLYPHHAYDFRPRVQALPPDGTVPGLPGWRWLHTPGHAFGHVALWREAGRLLVAGDAFTTVRGESGWATLTQAQEVHGPPAYFTPDWDAARASVQTLAALAPAVAATGHGTPMHGAELQAQLQRLAADFDTLARPATGRYAHQPATADTTGLRSVPPAPLQPWLLVAGVGVGLALAAGAWARRRGR